MSTSASSAAAEPDRQREALVHSAPCAAGAEPDRQREALVHSAPCAAGAEQTWWERILAVVDPRLRARVLADVEARHDALPLPADGHVVLVGHRAAGKSSVAPPIAERLGRPLVDLDEALERRHRRPVRAWFAEDAPGFRAAERALFTSLRKPSVVAAGGGFVALHAELLAGHLAVEVPLCFRTYRDRLIADHARPRLRPELPIEEELRLTWRSREHAHRDFGALPLGVFLGGLEAGR